MAGVSVFRVTVMAVGVAVLLAGPGVALAGSQTGDPYPLKTCISCSKELGDQAVTYMHDGREVRACCQQCLSKFTADPDKYLKEADKKIIEQQLPYYPLNTCVVSGEELGGEEMEEPYNYVYKNRLVRFCCKMCKGDFKKDPAKFLAKLNDAVVARQKSSYPLDTCVISGKKLGADGKEPVDYVFANRLVRFCCKGCIPKFKKAPAKYLGQIYKKDTTGRGGEGHGHRHGHEGHSH